MKDHIVLRVIAKLLIPLILLFGLYVQIHGEYSPGGGFQAGVLFAAGLILYALIFGLGAAHEVVSPRVAAVLAAGGALLYGAVGVWGMVAGGNFLEYKVLAASAQIGETVGIVLIELGVGITVAGVVLVFFYSFAGFKK
ncbi:MAG: Na(+)/H(+) antiporter subunit B [Gammaproteobacteria bacterium]